MRGAPFVLAGSLVAGAALVAGSTAGGGLAVSDAHAQACKAYAGGKCCDPAVTAHLTKDAIFGACGESDATYLGEKAGKDTCRYIFRIEGEGGRKEEAFVEVYSPAQKQVPPEPTDPFFSWKKVGKVFVTDRAKSPKSAPMLANATGLWLPGNGFFVSVNASTRVCTKPEAMRLARSVR